MLIQRKYALQKGKNDMNASKMACIYYEDIANPWMACLTYVPESFAEKAKEAVKKGLALFYEDANPEPYGECVMIAMDFAGIPYLIEFCEYDEETDEPYPSWELHVAEVANSKGLNFLQVEN